MESATHVAIVLNAPGEPALRDSDAAAVRAALGAPGYAWLDPGQVFEVPLLGPVGDDAVRAPLGQRRVDVAVVAAAHRRKKLLVADMDSTIIPVECLDELAARAGAGPQVAAITERAMRGELDFAAALRARVAMFRGKPVSLLDRTFRESVTLNPGARTLVRTMHESGAHAALVTGGFLYFTSRVAALAGFDSFSGNEFGVSGDQLDGSIVGPIFGADAKLARLRELMAAHNVLPAETLALGDGANDIPMLQAAGLGIAYHAKPKVRAASAARIDHFDLTAALFLQGYRRSEFVTG